MNFSEVVSGVVDYLERTIPKERNQETLDKIVSSAKEELGRREKWRQWEATKEYLRAHYKGWFNWDLEDEPWFIGWLDFLDGRGHQAFAYICGRCDGEGEVFPLIPPRDYDGHKIRCSKCNGEGMLQGPTYCNDKDCSGKNLHLQHWYSPSTEGLHVINKAEREGNNLYGAKIKPDSPRPAGIR